MWSPRNFFWMCLFALGFKAEIAQAYVLTGQVTNGTNGLSGVSVAAGTNLTMTDVNGNYSFTNLAGTFVVTPTNAGQLFNPLRQIMTMPPGLSNINFVKGLTNIATIVASCDQHSLAAAVALGGLVEFGCNGDLLLTNQLNIVTNLVLDGTNHQIVLDGGRKTRVAFVNPGINFTLANLIASNCLAQVDTTIYSGSNYYGGALWNHEGYVTVMGCSFVSNSCSPVVPSQGRGGAIFSDSITGQGNLTIIGCTFEGNFCVDGFNTNAGAGTVGGGIYNFGSTIEIINSVFIGNNAQGIDSEGGAIYNTSFLFSGNVMLSGCLFANNFCLTDSALSPNAVAVGGAIFSEGLNKVIATVSAVNCTFASNMVVDLGPDEATSGNAITATGGTYYTNFLYLTNCTFSANVNASNSFQVCLNAFNTPSVRGCVFQDTNSVPGDVYEVHSAIVDLGFNLTVSNPNPNVFFTNNTSHASVSTLIGPLANNGGPSMTCSPLPGSPCIDAITNGYYPPTDQRGFTRPYGKAADIGAVEYYPSNFTITSLTATGTSWQVQGNGFPLTTYLLQSSTNLLIWSTVQTNATGPSGLFGALDTSTRASHRFYRTSLP